MGQEETNLQQVLADAIQKERQAYQRATLLTAIPIVVGLLVFSYFTYRVIKLRQEAAALDQVIETKTKELKELGKSVDIARDESAALAVKADHGAQAEKALKEIARGTVDPKKQAAETLKAIDKPTPFIKPSPGPSPTPRPTPKNGFIGTKYLGQDKTVITVEVSASGTRFAASYDLDGKVVILSNNPTTFRFTLDKSKHDPSRLFMFFDFYDKDGVYEIKINTSDGNVLNVSVPQGDQITRTRVFYFDII